MNKILNLREIAICKECVKHYCGQIYLDKVLRASNGDDNIFVGRIYASV